VRLRCWDDLSKWRVARSIAGTLLDARCLALRWPDAFVERSQVQRRADGMARRASSFRSWHELIGGAFAVIRRHFSMQRR